MRRKRGPILSDDEVDRIRRDGISTRRRRKGLESRVTALQERLRKLAIAQPEVYASGMSYPEYRAMMKAESKLVQEMKAKRKAERNLIRSPRSGDGQ